MMDNERKNRQEQWEVEPLLKHLGVSAFNKCERPDFTFDYEGKHIGLEHTRIFPIGKTIDNNCWLGIERLIKQELEQSDLPPRLILYAAVTHADGKKNHKEIAEEILNGYRYMLAKGINSMCECDGNGFQFNKLTYLSYFPNIILEHFSLSEMTGGTECVANEDPIIDAVKGKEEKLLIYKELNKNSNIQEYWLAVYIPILEYCIIECDKTPFSNSLYDRIYLINGRYIEAMKTGDGTNIQRLK